MAFLDPKILKAQAKERLQESRSDTRTLILIYCGVIAGLTLASSGLQMYLNSQISATGGLSGMGLRSILQTIQSILSYINTFFGPFWQAGFLFAMIGIARGTHPGPKSLTEGFRRFGRILLYTLDVMLITSMVAVACIYAGSLLFSFSPWGTEFADAMGPVLTDPNLFAADGTVNLELIPTDVLMTAVPRIILLFLVVFVPVYVFLTYSLRMGTYLMMEGGRIGAMGAMILSFRMMKGHRFQMFKLDLSYWWYHGLLFLATIVAYLDVILEYANIQTGIDTNVMFFLTLIAYCVMDLAISLWKKCEVDTTYVLAYEAIAHPEKPAQEESPAPVEPA